jgi:F420-non-reducing hydrogenase iron-sulfur subunit
MCTGRIDLEFVLRALANGADGVFVVGCRLNECNYITHGNYDALNMVQLAKKLMEHVGLNPERLMIEFMSAGDGILFAETVTDFVKKIKSIGPQGQPEGISRDEIQSRLTDVMKLVPYIKVAMKEKISLHLDSRAKYDDLYSLDEINKFFEDVVSYYIDPEKCQACSICLRKCPVEAINGAKGMVHIIDQDKCIRCGTCFENCPPKFAAIKKIVHEPVPPPLPEDQRAVVRAGGKSE